MRADAVVDFLAGCIGELSADGYQTQEDNPDFVGHHIDFAHDGTRLIVTTDAGEVFILTCVKKRIKRISKIP